jgi:hypothetical protein
MAHHGHQTLSKINASAVFLEELLLREIFTIVEGVNVSLASFKTTREFPVVSRYDSVSVEYQNSTFGV